MRHDIIIGGQSHPPLPHPLLAMSCSIELVHHFKHSVSVSGSGQILGGGGHVPPFVICI